MLLGRNEKLHFEDVVKKYVDMQSSALDAGEMIAQLKNWLYLLNPVMSLSFM